LRGYADDGAYTITVWGTKNMRLKIAFAALAATIAFVSPAQAQTVAATAEARGLVLQPLTLSRVDDLDFGTVISSAVAGSVSIDEGSGFRTLAGGVAAGPAAGNRGLFAGAGTAGQQVDLDLTYPAVLVSGANTVAITSLTFDTGGGVSTTRTIGASGTFQIGVGGVFAIGANQPAGLYTATFQVTAEYL
jgi:hypothetical protein